LRCPGGRCRPQPDRLEVRAAARPDRCRVRRLGAVRVPRAPRRRRAEDLLLDALLTWCRERGLLKARGQQRTASTHVLAAVRALNRLELVSEVMRHALDTLAVAHPAWLRANAQAEWAERYARRAEDARLP